MSESSAFRFRPQLVGMENRYTPAAAPLPNPLTDPPAGPDTTLISILPNTLNDRVASYLQSHLGQQIGGGEAADAAIEALRAAGAAFIPGGGPDDPAWSSTPILQVTGVWDGQAVYSDPSVRLRPGDVLQFTGATFADGRVAKRHTAVVAAVDAAGRVTAVFEQNVGKLGRAEANRFRFLVNQPLDLSTLASGTVTAYRPEPRPTQPDRVQFTLVNHTDEAVTVTVQARKFDYDIPLTAADTDGSYTTVDMKASGAEKPTLTVGKTTIGLRDGAAYEVFETPDGETSIRMVA